MARYDIEYDNSGVVNVIVDSEKGMVCIHSKNGRIYTNCVQPVSYVKQLFDAGDTLVICDEHFWNRPHVNNSTVTITNIVPTGDPI